MTNATKTRRPDAKSSTDDLMEIVLNRNLKKQLANKLLMATLARAAAEGAVLTVPVRPDVFKDLLGLIQPSPDDKAECHEKLRKHIATIRELKRVFDVPSPPAFLAELAQFHEALKRANDLMLQLSPDARGALFDPLIPDGTPAYDKFANDLGSLVRETGAPGEVRTDGRPFSISKHSAARYAHSLVANFSPSAPALTKGGRFSGREQIIRGSHRREGGGPNTLLPHVFPLIAHRRAHKHAGFFPVVCGF